MVAGVAVWLSWLWRQSHIPEVTGSSPIGSEKLAVGRTFSGQSYKIFSISGQAFHSTQVITFGTWYKVSILDYSTLSTYNPQLLGLYTPEWR